MLLRTLPLRLKLVAALILPLAVVAGYLTVRVNSAFDDRQVALAQLEEVEKFEAVAAYAATVGTEGAVLTDFTTSVEDMTARRAETDAAWASLTDPSLGLSAETLADLDVLRNQLLDSRDVVGPDPAASRTEMQTMLATGVDTGTYGTAFVQAGEQYPLILAQFDFDIDAISDVEEAQLLVDFASIQRIRANVTQESSAMIGVGGLPAEAMDFGALSFMGDAGAKVSEAFATARELGSPDTVAILNEFEASQSWFDYNEVRTAADAFRPGVAPEGVGSIGTTVLAGQVDTGLQQIVDYISAQINERATATSDDANQQLLRSLIIGGTLLALVSLIVFALYRAIRKPLQDLTEQSQRIADVELPTVVQAMRQGDIDSVPEIEEIEAFTNDEIGELVSAFNGMHRTAVGLAAEQAGSRRVVADMFVNLGRRNQKLLNRMLKGLGQLEQSEQDPDKLQALYKVDHLATRMRRNAESLLILAGASQSRNWNKPVPVYDVIQAALSEVENFERVTVVSNDGEMIKGEHVADMAHMIAELTENALAFSPPNTQVEVLSSMTQRGYVVVVSDTGIGMPTDELQRANERIIAAAAEDETPSEFLGHYVVGRLAARNGFNVDLLEGVTAGITARISLPESAFARPEAEPTPAPAPVEVPQIATPADEFALTPATDEADSAPVDEFALTPQVDEFALTPQADEFAAPAADDAVVAADVPMWDENLIDEELADMTAGGIELPAPFDQEVEPTSAETVADDSNDAESFVPSSDDFVLDPSAPLVAPVAAEPTPLDTASLPVRKPTVADIIGEPALVAEVAPVAEAAPVDAFAAARRTPGANLPSTSIRTTHNLAVEPDLGDADDVRASLAGFQSGTVQADKENQS